MKVVIRLWRGGDKSWPQESCRDAALAVVNHRVANVNPECPATRRVKLHHTAKIIRKKSPSTRFEEALNEREPAKDERPGTDEVERPVKADEAGPRLAEESEPLESLTDFDAKLTLQQPAPGPGSDALGGGKVVDHGFKTNSVVEIESEPAAHSGFSLRAVPT